MKRPYIVNLYYSLFLIFIGLLSFAFRYIEAGDFQFTALIPAVFGFVLIMMTGAVKKEDPIASHAIVGLTFILAVIVSVMFIINLTDGNIFTRKMLVFFLVMHVSYVVISIYVARFIAIKKKKALED